MRDTGIADRIRAKGVRVIEMAGWQTNGSDSFNPVGSVNHHTAGPSSGSTPSLNTCLYGNGSTNGPLCQVMQSREPDGNDIAYVIAAGKANHAGEGGWGGMSGNSSVYGLEIEHTGVDPLPMHRQHIAAKIHAAFHDRPDKVCQHREWAPSRKIDAAENVDANGFRDMVRSYESGGTTPVPPPSQGGFDLSDDQYNKIMKELDTIKDKVDSNGGGQNLIYEKTMEKLNWMGAKLCKDPNNVYWIVTSAGRWRVNNAGKFTDNEIIDWMRIMGLVCPGNSIKVDLDYLKGIPMLDDPGVTPTR
jgi:hypothetical protein